MAPGVGVPVGSRVGPRRLRRTHGRRGAAGIPVRTVETPAKAATYAAAVGPVSVRLSSPDQWLTHDGPASTVAGRMTDTPRERLQLAREAARGRRAAGRRCGRPAAARADPEGRPGSVANVRCAPTPGRTSSIRPTANAGPLPTLPRSGGAFCGRSSRGRAGRTGAGQGGGAGRAARRGRRRWKKLAFIERYGGIGG